MMATYKCREGGLVIMEGGEKKNMTVFWQVFSLGFALEFQVSWTTLPILWSFIFFRTSSIAKKSTKSSFLVKRVPLINQQRDVSVGKRHVCNLHEAAHQQYLGELGDLRERVTREAGGEPGSARRGRHLDQ